jgi:hypothetical protein
MIACLILTEYFRLEILMLHIFFFHANSFTYFFAYLSDFVSYYFLYVSYCIAYYLLYFAYQAYHRYFLLNFAHFFAVYNTSLQLLEYVFTCYVFHTSYAYLAVLQNTNLAYYCAYYAFSFVHHAKDIADIFLLRMHTVL